VPTTARSDAVAWVVRRLMRGRNPHNQLADPKRHRAAAPGACVLAGEKLQVAGLHLQWLSARDFEVHRERAAEVVAALMMGE
jgi:hypothetical protein